MKTSSLLLYLVLLLPFYAKSQSRDSTKSETFEYKDGDSTYVMKKYFICFLKKGDNRTHDKATAADIQNQHLAHIGKMAAAGQISIAGPMADDGDLRGIFIFNVPTLEEATRLANEDPAVKAGRLKVELHPWWAAQGSKLK